MRTVTFDERKSLRLLHQQPGLESLRGMDVLSADDFTRTQEEALFRLADGMARYQKSLLPPEFLLDGRFCLFFEEPSTRTFDSSAHATHMLGGHVMGYPGAKSFSSLYKGENLYDTGLVLGLSYHGIVARVSKEGGVAEISRGAKAAAEVIRRNSSNVLERIPLINGGDGKGEHPTQALLDLLTIKRERGEIDGSRIAMVGDLERGRTVWSLSKALSKYSGVCIDFVSHEYRKMPVDRVKELGQRGMSVTEHTTSLRAYLQETRPDFIYMTRSQRERNNDTRDEIERERAVDAARRRFRITDSLIDRLPVNTRIMHPLPKNDELVVSGGREIKDPRIAYVRQMNNGIHVRAALFSSVFRNSAE